MFYYYDCEFLEGTQDKMLMGMKVGKTKPTIDMISIGIVSEDNREYYAISKDFNLKEAWNRYDEKINTKYNPEISESTYNPMYIRTYWIRENVLKPIYKELHNKECLYSSQAFYRASVYIKEPEFNFTYKNMKKLINKYGKSSKQISEEVYNFCSNDYHKGNNLSFKQRVTYDLYDSYKPTFYGYYSAYDHVTLCWLFGKMIDLPEGFPMYTIDLKQILDEKVIMLQFSSNHNAITDITKLNEYPKQTNEHNALSDAKWNKQLHEFLNTL